MKLASKKRVKQVVCAATLLLMSVAALHAQTVKYSNPVIPGDYPDPSVIRVGEDFWATTTSGEWEPTFALMHSRDLINWESAGAVFRTHPAWASNSFWAPEISEYDGTYFVYYTARKIAGPLCVAVAVSSVPQGPYTDHGPLVCQHDGSIDAFATVDENGERYLIWKEDGNSQNEPTPIWAQRLSRDGLTLLGEKSELIRNDVNWERNVVEAPYVLRRGEYFYLFYAGAGCCGLKCDYGVGVARSKKLLGPWEKYSQNPIVSSNRKWKCPGHGSIVSDANGRQFFLFHSYLNGNFSSGRQAVLERVLWTDDGWPAINDSRGVSEEAESAFNSEQIAFPLVSEDFRNNNLIGWEWPIGKQPQFGTLRPNNRGLLLETVPTSTGIFGSMIARRAQSQQYVASTAVLTTQHKEDGMGGLAVFGGADRATGVGVSANQVVFWEARNSRPVYLHTIRQHWGVVHIRAVGGTETIQFEISPDGTNWQEIGKSSGLFAPPWEGSLRLALYTGSSRTAKTQFQFFRMAPQIARQSHASAEARTDVR